MAGSKLNSRQETFLRLRMFGEQILGYLRNGSLDFAKYSIQLDRRLKDLALEVNNG